MVSDGRADVFKREEGILIVIVHSEYDQMNIRRLVSHLGTTTAIKYNMFMDAEVDYGEQLGE
jgi:hypothetical protein